MALLPTDRPIIFDSPGQIESFVWSASGEILLQAFPDAACIYVVDGSRCAKPSVFVSSMLYCLSIQHRLKIAKMIVCLNKSDLLQEPCNRDFAKVLRDNDYISEDTPDSDVTNQTLVSAFTTESLVINDCFSLTDENDYQGSFLSQVTLYLDKFW